MDNSGDVDNAELEDYGDFVESGRPGETAAGHDTNETVTTTSATLAHNVIPSIEADDDYFASRNIDYDDETIDEHGERLDTVLQTPSPTRSSTSGSIPDDTPSPYSIASAIRYTSSPTTRDSISRRSSGIIKPFERRFQSRFSISPSPVSRAGSQGFLQVRSRQSSLSSNVISPGDGQTDPDQTPWEVVRWTRLRKITGQAFSEIGKRQLGSPTCIAIASIIVIGTSKGLILIFDYHQSLKNIIGQATKAAESGAITSLAISGDHTTVAGGHASGNIFTWEITKPAKPFLAIQAITPSERAAGAEGHLSDRAILHVAFLGVRRTALVSADDKGMAFSHLASRGLGAVGRSVKTSRLLGRYPSIQPAGAADVLKKPSSVLALAPLPLGNIDREIDLMGVTAMLTPYLLVIVSTTPVAQTQYKSPRPKDLTPHGTMTGCLAWFPAMKMKDTTPVEKSVAEAKLVYVWSEILTVLEVEQGLLTPGDNQKEPPLYFRPRSRWKCEEAIVAVQWLSQSVIGVLTISQRLIILEDGALHVMDSVDLLQKHIYHRDIFSTSLTQVVEASHDEAAEMHGVIADAFYMSFKSYKGRLFLLGVGDVSVGTLSNWADRLTALMEHGDDLAAIQLGVDYYKGGAGKTSLGLPNDDLKRHELVKDKVLDLLQGSLQFRLKGPTPDVDRVQELVQICFRACLAIGEEAFLLDHIYDAFVDGLESELFLDTLEPFITDGEIKALPPLVIKDLVAYYTVSRRHTKLEELLCRLEADTFDIDQVTKLCRTHLLYDALIYVWNQALADWISPLVDLVLLIRDREEAVSPDYNQEDIDEAASTIFPYLVFSLTGRAYPHGDIMEDAQAHNVQTQLYKFLFSPMPVKWPEESDTIVKTSNTPRHEPDFPYLTLLLQFDTSAFLSVLNEAFEDPYLNPQEASSSSGRQAPEINGAISTMTRQQILSILLETMSSDVFHADQRIYLDIFMARSLSKYSQFLVFSTSTLESIFQRLCTHYDRGLADECQLSVEYLSSVYRPQLTEDLVKTLRQVEFWRVLKLLFRGEKRYVEFFLVLFADTNQINETLDQDLRDCFKNDVAKEQQEKIKDLLCEEYATSILNSNISETVQLVQAIMPEREGMYISALTDAALQYKYLKELFDSNEEAGDIQQIRNKYLDQYIQLMCRYDANHVATFISTLDSNDLHLDNILPAMESNNVIDAAILLLAKEGAAQKSMDRLEKHVDLLSTSFCNMMTNAPEEAIPVQAVRSMLSEIEKYFDLGIWLCQGQSRISERPDDRLGKSKQLKRYNSSRSELMVDESLWLSFLETVVHVSQSISRTMEEVEHIPPAVESLHPSTAIRILVQMVFTSLLTSTTCVSSSNRYPSKASSGLAVSSSFPADIKSTSFLKIFRLFLLRLASSSSSSSAPIALHLRPILHDIFTAYHYESSLLSLASNLLGRETFSDNDSIRQYRNLGWRPNGQVCSLCKLRAWGRGIGLSVWESWVTKERRSDDRAHAKIKKEILKLEEEEKVGDMRYGLVSNTNQDRRRSEHKGKGKEIIPSDQGRIMGEYTADSNMIEKDGKRADLIVFACRHIYHRRCLDDLEDSENMFRNKDVEVKYICLICKGQKKVDESK